MIEAIVIGIMPQNLIINDKENIIIGGLSLSKEAQTADSRFILVSVRQIGREFGIFTSGYVPPYCINNIETEGIRINGQPMIDGIPAKNEAKFEIVIVSLD